jgi:CRISPR/Cas system CMR subunit Cmr4 (Cas7 group RAMP superfamily)
MNDFAPPETRRPIAVRWVVTAHIAFDSASQVGAHESDYCDQTFARDSRGLPVLPGTSLAGALRQAIVDRLAGYRSSTVPSAVRDLFGSLESSQSSLIVFDGVIDGPPTAAHIRDSVRIVGSTGLAADKGKFDREILAPGLRFRVRFELLCPTAPDEPALLQTLLSGLQLLADGSVRFGARKSRGLGCAHAAAFQARRFDLTTEAGWRAYAVMDYANPTAGAPAFDDPAGAIRSALPTGSGLDVAETEDRRQSAAIQLEFGIPGGLLVRSPGRRPDDPDASQLIEKGPVGDAAVLPGTSIAGLLRHHVQRIASTLGLSDAGNLVTSLFGHGPADATDGVVAKPTGSRVSVTESRSPMPRVLRQARVKIDRLTGGPVDTALFDEAPVFGSVHSVAIHVKNPTAMDIRLLLLAGRDITEGTLAVGGSRAVGRGFARSGSVRVTLPDGGGWLSLHDDYGAIEEALARMERTEP